MYNKRGNRNSISVFIFMKWSMLRWNDTPEKVTQINSKLFDYENIMMNKLYTC